MRELLRRSTDESLLDIIFLSFRLNMKSWGTILAIWIQITSVTLGTLLLVMLWKLERKKKQILKSELEKIPSRICLTSDCWTSLAGDGYIAVTAHYVDAKWVLHSKILSFCEVLPLHSCEVLASKVHECLREWGIERMPRLMTTCKTYWGIGLI